MTKSSRKAWIITLVTIGCLSMAWVDAYLDANYLTKSIIKVVLFLLLPIGYSLTDHEVSFKNLFRFTKKHLIISLIIGAGVYAFIIGAYFLIGPYFDFSNVTKQLQTDIGVNSENFIFVALYISFANSLLEEFFFRGFAFITLKKAAGKRFAYIFSSGAFAFFHIAIMKSWFSTELFILLIAGLFTSGFIFNWLNDKSNNIYTSWLVHMFANFAINTVGFMLFGLL